MTGGSSTPAPSDAHTGFSGTGSFTDFFAGSSAKGAQTAATGQGGVTCPPLDVRQGASTLTVSPAGDSSAMSIRYQGAFVRMARNCTVADGNMTMRIGIEGRVVVGPTGGPGEVVVPLRIAVVQETPGGTKPVTTKFIRIPVTLEAGDSRKLFAHVEEGLSFPVPSPTSQLDDYVAYIGFDPLSAQAAEKPKPAPRPRVKPKPAASAN
ncbi:MAG: hypothetical protein ABSD09_04520 [Xanthobacteraceae bacterium]|jgi:hypothetical protein